MTNENTKQIKPTAICIATVSSVKTLQVLHWSIEQYVDRKVELYLVFQKQKTSKFYGPRKVHSLITQTTTFGQAYNRAVNAAFNDGHEHILVMNDDIVLDPDTVEIMTEDYNTISKEIGEENIGWVGCLTNYGIGLQNIRNDISSEKRHQGVIKNEREKHIIETDFIAPICAMISKKSWLPYLPINYFSDNIQCHQMKEQNKRHFLSTAYVHHVGSQSIQSGEIEIKKTLDYLDKNHQDLSKYIREIIQ